MRAFAFVLFVVTLAAGEVAAQPYPSRPVRMLVGFPPGGGTDITARLLAPKLTEYLGQPFVVENRPGAATNVATDVVAKAPPDGYTLLFTTTALAINMSLYKNLPFDALRDFAPVSVFAESPNLLVANPSAGSSVAGLVAQAKAKPGALNYSSAGSGTTQHLAGEVFKVRSHTEIVHIPYKGTAASLTAVVAGEVQFSFANVPAILGHVKSGRLRALAVAGPHRSDLMPEVPTLKEAGVEGVEVPVWYALLAPAATPREAVAALADATARAARSADTKQRLVEQGADPVGNTPAEFVKLLRSEVSKYAEVVRISGAKPE
ncbi:MAG TPA: tripartite tricarboxylate transporter substrate binding protein [Burkholderiales bacterium]|nr:tripartite tricarboxylate transporter substrate binding protein [Burkholderiales bacterium]